MRKQQWQENSVKKAESFKRKYIKSKGLNVEFIKPVPAPKIAVQNIKVKNNLEVRDTEEMVIYTNGPAKITYSSAYNVIKITPHTVTLT